MQLDFCKKIEKQYQGSVGKNFADELVEFILKEKEIQLPDSRCNGKGIDPWISFDREGKEPIDPWISFDKDSKVPIDPWISFDTGGKEPIDPWISFDKDGKKPIDPFIVYAEQKSNRSGWKSKMALMKATAQKQEKQGLGYIFRFFSNNNAKKERRIL